MKTPHHTMVRRSVLASAPLILAMICTVTARAQGAPMSGPPFLGIPLVDMKLAAVSTLSGVQLSWINAYPAQKEVSYVVYRNIGLGFVPFSGTRGTALTDVPPIPPHYTATYEVKATWNSRAIPPSAVSGPVSVVIAAAPIASVPVGGLSRPPQLGCRGVANLTGGAVFANPSPEAGGVMVYLQADFPSATQFPGGAKLILKDNNTQAVTTFPMAYYQWAASNGTGWVPGYVQSVLLGKKGDPAQLSYTVTMEAIEADCSYHSFSTQFQNANGVL